MTPNYVIIVPVETGSNMDNLAWPEKNVGDIQAYAVDAWAWISQNSVVVDHIEFTSSASIFATALTNLVANGQVIGAAVMIGGGAADQIEIITIKFVFTGSSSPQSLTLTIQLPIVANIAGNDTTVSTAPPTTQTGSPDYIVGTQPIFIE